MSSKISIDELAAALTQPYVHLELGQVNDHAVYLVRFKGDYEFHRHTRDEMYMVLEGEAKILFSHEPPLVLKRTECAVTGVGSSTVVPYAVVGPYSTRLVDAVEVVHTMRAVVGVTSTADGPVRMVGPWPVMSASVRGTMR